MSKDNKMTAEVSADLDRINPAPLGHGFTTHSGIIHQVGDSYGAVGVKDFTNRNSQPIDANTMMAEGSIGKVRFAGLAYMLQQEGVIDLQANAKEFFADKAMGQFLDAKYPGQNMQTEILKLFKDNNPDKTNNKNATLADLLTHRSGIGDLTRDQGRVFGKEGVRSGYDLPTLLKIPDDCRKIERDGGDGKPTAHNPDLRVPEADFPKAEYGKHQYSNLGYALMGVAMEAAYDMHNFAPGEKTRNYKEIMNEYVLHPSKGRAASKVDFSSTKFPEEIKEGDNHVVAHWMDPATKTQVNANLFDGANAAGGIFTSTNDSVKFFGEFFKGFPGTQEEGKNANVFFSDETIHQMVAEGLKFGNGKDYDIRASAGRDDKSGNLRFQGPGFSFEVDEEAQAIVQYDKNGGTFGYESLMKFNPQTGTVDIGIVTNENVSHDIAKKVGVSLEDLRDAYKVGEKPYDRGAMFNDYSRNDMKQIETKVLASQLRKSMKEHTMPNIGDVAVSSFREKMAKSSVEPQHKNFVEKMKSQASKGRSHEI